MRGLIMRGLVLADGDEQQLHRPSRRRPVGQLDQAPAAAKAAFSAVKARSGVAIPNRGEHRRIAALQRRRGS